MKGRALIDAVIARRYVGRDAAVWAGHLSNEARDLYFAALNLPDRGTHGASEIIFANAVGGDVVWLSPEANDACWAHPEGKPIWNCLPEQRGFFSFCEPGIFAMAEDPAEIADYEWPDPQYLDLAPAIRETRSALDCGLAVFGGMHCSFFHVVSDFFGMENYFLKMYTHPAVVHAVTERVVAFYLEANQRVLETMAPDLSACLIVNELGSQRAPLVGLNVFDAFIAPYLKELVNGVHAQGLPVAMHSCGSIEPFIPRFIELGIDILHPLQASAAGMDAETLSRKYKDRILFMGGVDTQRLLPFGTPDLVHKEVARLRDLFGDGYIVAPSHELLLRNIPIEQVFAMIDGAKHA